MPPSTSTSTDMEIMARFQEVARTFRFNFYCVEDT